MKIIIKLFAILVVSASIAVYAVLASSDNEQVDDDNTNSKKYKVYISQLVKHPALDETTRGIIDGLKDRGYREGDNLEIQTAYAQGNVSLATQIAQNFVSDKPDVVVGVATVAAQSLFKYAREGRAKLVFASVTDPVAARLVKSLQHPESNTSGVSNYVAIEPQLEMFKKIRPNLKRLGFIYNPGEMNSLSLISELQKICPKFDIELVTMVATKTNEVQQSARNLAEKVDAIFISNDNTALSAIRTIVNESNKQQIPVFVSDTDIVNQGALAALGPNQYDLGLKSAKIIDMVLKGEDINAMPIVFPDTMELVINMKAAKKIGAVMSQDLIDSATKIID